MVFTPAQTLTEFSQLENFAIGDLLLTGTPGGVAIQPPRAFVQRIAGLLPESAKWDLFIKKQAGNPRYLVSRRSSIGTGLRSGAARADRLCLAHNAIEKGRGYLRPRRTPPIAVQ